MYKWTILLALCVIFVLYTIDRALLGLLAIPIQAETGISDVRFGILGSAIFWAYALAAPFAGMAGDRFNRARLIGCAVIGWSLMVLVAGFSDGFWSLLLLASFAVVIPQTLYSPSANAYIASLHVDTRTVAMSCHQAAFYTGWFVSGMTVAGIVAWFGSWRSVFFVLGGFGIVVGALFLVMTGGSTAAQQRGGVVVKPLFKDSLRAFWGCKSALLASVGYVAVVFVGCGYCTWGPKFIGGKFSISAAESGVGVMFWHYASAFVSILVAGSMTDRYVKRFPRFRLVLAMFAFALAIPCLLLFAFGSTVTVALAGSALLGSMFGILGANQFTNLFDVIPSAYRSGAIGFLNVAAGLIGSLSSVFLGMLSQRYGQGGFEWGFAGMSLVLAIPIVCLAVSYLFTFNKERIVGE